MTSSTITYSELQKEIFNLRTLVYSCKLNIETLCESVKDTPCGCECCPYFDEEMFNTAMDNDDFDNCCEVKQLLAKLKELTKNDGA